MTGPALWVRVWHRMGPRLSEWMLSFIMFGIGTVLLVAVDLFHQPIYSGFRVLFGGTFVLGTVLLVLGIARLVGLVINGSMAMVTPWIRVVSALGGATIWVGFTFAYMLSGVLGFWAIIFPAFAAWEFVNIRRAARDAGDAHAVRTS